MRTRMKGFPSNPKYLIIYSPALIGFQRGVAQSILVWTIMQTRFTYEIRREKEGVISA